jgi:hypothetical protein
MVAGLLAIEAHGRFAPLAALCLRFAIAEESIERVAQRRFARGSVIRICGVAFELACDGFGGGLVLAVRAGSDSCSR